MITLSKARDAWNTPGFKTVLKEEVEQLDRDFLPLQQGLSHSSYANADSLSVMVMSAADDGGYIRAKAGLFYTGIIAGCNCADDPTPPEEQNEYCEVQLDIRKDTGEAKITLLAD